ncbi:MAG: hypothetical protein HFG51_05060 [Lachnospiraceae bacterium]|nr:hypothetical protein [Lachnospiraceae bacterium]
MNVVKCINGHYYDSSRFAVCPFCQEREFVPKTQYKREDSEIVLREAQKSKKITAAVKIRIVTWICYTVGLSILPTIIYVLIDSLFGVGLSDLDKFISDFFVLTLVISSTTLKGIVDDKLWVKSQMLFLVIFTGTFFVLLLLSILYGAITYCFLSGVVLEYYVKIRFFILSVAGCILSFIFGLAMQVIGGMINEI